MTARAAYAGPEKHYEVRVEGNDPAGRHAHGCKRTRDEAILWAGYNVGLARAQGWRVTKISIRYRGQPVALPKRQLDIWRDAGVLAYDADVDE